MRTQKDWAKEAEQKAELEEMKKLSPVELRKEVKRKLMQSVPHGYRWNKKRLEQAISSAMVKFREAVERGEI